MKHLRNNAIWILPTILVLIIFSLALSLAYADLQPKGRLTCRNFGSYDDALISFKSGNIQLDGGKHNGIPCENLLPEIATTADIPL